MDPASSPESMEALLSVDQFEKHIWEWSRQNDARDVIYKVSDMAT